MLSNMFVSAFYIGRLAILVLCVVLAVPAAAVIIASGDGTGNTSAPADDPGWSYVGSRGGLSAVYLGNGWVVTANHVSEGEVILDGVTYPAVAGSKVRIDDGAGTLADLAVFQIDPYPAWPLLPISHVADISGSSVVMIGKGRNRGSATSACLPPTDGFLWGSGTTMRWGENVVTSYETALNTAAFTTTFDDRNALTHEAQAANGDSGGAVFVDNGGTWELAGVMFAISGFGCQPSSSAFFGNVTYSSDLAAYRDQIIPIVRPQCSDEIDNDGDSLVDFPDDPDCSSELDGAEAAIAVSTLDPLGLFVLMGPLLAIGCVQASRMRSSAG